MPTRERLANEPDDDTVVTGSLGKESLGKDAKDGNDPEAPPRRKRRRGLKIFLIILGVLALLLGAGAIGGALYLRSVDKSVKRVDAFQAVPEAGRPAKAAEAKGAINFLILGSDTRDPQNTGGSRSDTIILMHLDKNRSNAQLVSIPRDTWTHIPKSADGKHGDTTAKINAAYAWGGVPLTVQTVEAFTGVRVDHVIMVDFAGFKEIVDAFGGVTIDVEESFTSTSPLNPGKAPHYDKGPQLMNGSQALDYARERYSFKDGDFARIRHQQQVIKAILNKAASGGMLTNPAQLNAFLKATANAATVDSTLNIFDTAADLRHLRSDNLTFFTNPTKGTGMVGSESVVFPDTAKDKPFYEAIRDDTPIPAQPN
jgi:LCP family protein required for cell wall assembly